MAFKRRFRRKFKRRFFKRKRGRGNRRLAKRVRRIERTIETKILDGSVDLSVSTTANVTHLTALSQGVTSKTRIGDKVHFSSIEMNMEVVGKDSFNRMFVALVLAKHINGIAPSALEIYNFGAYTIAMAYLAQRNFPERKKFRVLRVWRILLNGTDPTNFMPWIKKFKYHRKLNFTTYYNGNAGTVADVEHNGLFLISISDSAAVTHPTISVDMRLKYQDA